MEKQGGDIASIDLDKSTVMLATEKNDGGGLFVPGKDKVMFRPLERKSLLGLDVLANTKRQVSGDGKFKVPRERFASFLTSIEEEEKSEASGIDDKSVRGEAYDTKGRANKGRHYREVLTNRMNSNGEE